jgi:hypothetical protein
MEVKTKYVEGELKNLLSRFINEIDLSFDYVDKSVIDRLRKMLRKMDNEEEYNKFTNDTLIKLREYEKNISYIMMSKRKLRGVDYDFLNNVVLFNDLLDFKIFKDENKNTKRTICTYLYNIYMTISVINNGMSGVLGEEFIDFVKDLQKRMESDVLKEEENRVKSDKSDNYIGDNVANMANMASMANVANMANMANIRDKLGGQGFSDVLNQMVGDKDILSVASKKASGFNNIFENLMGNSGILSMATELSKNIQEENIDPMSILSSMMSGRPDETVQRLIKNISGKLEEKINNGEIDKELLEEQAKNMFEMTNMVEEID